MDIAIYVLTHKHYKIPDDSIYIPIQSGSALYPDLGYQRDDDGDNISAKNAAYNMLCPMYWIWKHSDADYIGIVHYRRLFQGNGKQKDPWKNVLSGAEAEELCLKNDIILPPKSFYPFFNLETHYIYTFKDLKTVHKNDLKTLRQVLADLYPGSEFCYDKVMKKSSGHQGNISLMKRELYDDYCEFMFNVLFECEKRLEGKRHDYNRYIAGLAEFIPDIWIEKNGYNYKEVKLFMPEEPPLIKKVFFLFMRMFFGRRDPHRYNAGSNNAGAK